MGNYLYNGVELPELPEHDKTVYPYALILRREYASSIGHYLYLSSTPFFYKVGTLLGSTTYKPITKNDGSALCYVLDILVSTGAYYDPSTGNTVDAWCRYENGDKELTADTTTSFSYPRFWANYDVLNYEDDSVILPASDPVPVGGETEPDTPEPEEPEPDTPSASNIRIYNPPYIKLRD